MRLPKPIHYTDTEGGDWIKWADRPVFKKEILANCIVFDNGHAFDMVSGWRKNFKYDKKTGERI